MMFITRQWWLERTFREQALLAGLGALAGFFMVYQFVFKPITDFRIAAMANHQAASAYVRDVQISANRIFAAEEPSGGASSENTQPLRVAASSAARGLGLTIARVQPAANNGLDIWFDNAAAASLFKWVDQLHQNQSVSVARAYIQRNDDSSVRAQVTLSGGSQQ